MNGAVNRPPQAPEIAALIATSESRRRTRPREMANEARPAAAIPVGTSGPRLNPAISETAAIATPPGTAFASICPVANATNTFSSAPLGAIVWMTPTAKPPAVMTIRILIEPEKALGSSWSGHSTL